jgi:uncharacterized membrane protein YozB (DUF420 family)
MTAEDIPTVNACLNTACTVLLVAGYVTVRLRRILLHKVCMLAALGVSALFLALYLYFHFVVKGGKPTRFAERAREAPEWVAYLYYAVLGTHTVLAAIVAPLALYVAYLGLRDRLQRHTRLARWTLPAWLYVTVTGVVVYWMLYRLYP